MSSITYDICLSKAPLQAKSVKELKGASSLNAVVIGGGSGASISIRALLALGFTTSAVVAMADDGGSTGILRKEIDCTTPGDIRNCLAAFAKDPDGPIASMYQSRFDFLSDHCLGNLMLASLENKTGSFKEAISLSETILESRGHVYPSTYSHVTLCAETIDGRTMSGQASACASDMALSKIWLSSDGPIVPNEDAINAIKNADLIVLGPGSLFTSVLTNIAIPEIANAINSSDAPIITVCPLADYQGESKGLSVCQCIESLISHGLKRTVSYALVHCPQSNSSEICVPEATDEQLDDLRKSGISILADDYADKTHTGWHSIDKLAQAIEKVVCQCHLLRK